MLAGLGFVLEVVGRVGRGTVHLGAAALDFLGGEDCGKEDHSALAVRFIERYRVSFPESLAE